MEITNITEYNKTKVLVQLDEHLIFPLYKSELRIYRIAAGEELDEKVYQELFYEVLPKRVKMRAMHLLQKRDYTVAKLRQKLIESHYPENLVRIAVDYVSDYGYLDDVRYAENYIRSVCESKSRRKIEQDLYIKGVTAEDISAAWIRFEASDRSIDEVAQIKAYLQRKGYEAAKTDYKTTLKIMNALYRKGYSAEAIRKTIRVPDTYGE